MFRNCCPRPRVSVLPSLSEGTLEYPARIDGCGRPRGGHQGGGQSGGHRRRSHRPACAAAGFGRTSRRHRLVCWKTKTWLRGLAQAGMRRVAELFSIERSVHETEHLYQRLVEANGSRMKILLIGPYPPPHGGISVHVSGIHRQLMAAGIPCRVLDTGRDPPRAGFRHRTAAPCLPRMDAAPSHQWTQFEELAGRAGVRAGRTWPVEAAY